LKYDGGVFWGIFCADVYGKKLPFCWRREGGVDLTAKFLKLGTKIASFASLVKITVYVAVFVLVVLV
jgi:hypothetical protein